METAGWEGDIEPRKPVDVQAEQGLDFSSAQLDEFSAEEANEHPPNPTVLCLPDAIIMSIFSHMPLKERGIAMRTCKRMKFLGCLPLSWKPVSLSLERNYRLPSVFWNQFKKSAPRYDVINATDSVNEENIVNSLIPFGQHLVEIIIPALGLNTTHHQHNLSARLLQHCPNLQSLVFSISNDFATRYLSSLQKLENLAVHILGEPDNLQLGPEFLEQLAKLKSLQLKGRWSGSLLNVAALQNQSFTFSKLTHFSFDCFYTWNQVQYAAFLAKCPNLIWFADKSYFHTTWILDLLTLNCLNIQHIEFDALPRSGLLDGPYPGRLKSVKKIIIHLRYHTAHPELDGDLNDNAFIASFPAGVLEVKFKKVEVTHRY